MKRNHFMAIVLTTALAFFLAPGLMSETSAQTKKASTTQKKSSSKSKTSRSKSKSKSSPKSKSKSSSKSKSKTKAKPAAGRLPPYFGQVDLKPEQVESVYKVQNKYKSQIEKLQKELDAAKAKQMKDMEAVLTSTQKRKLSSLRNAAAKKKKK